MRWIRMELAAVALSLVVLGAACGGSDDVNAPAPQTWARGGVGSGAIKGDLNVTVIEGITGAAVEGATVRVGAAAATTPVTGTTDANGVVILKHGSLKGAQDVTVTASGYAAATWTGVNGANVTIPLTVVPPAAVSMAHVEGTIQGLNGTSWNASSWTAAASHIIIGYVNSSAVDPVTAPENNIVQDKVTVPGTQLQLPVNLCVKLPSASFPNGTYCDFKLKTHAGKQVLYAVIVDVNTNGNLSDPTQWTTTVLDYAFLFGLDLVGGTSATGQTLTPVGPAGMVNQTVAFPAAPSTMTAVGASAAIRMPAGATSSDFAGTIVLGNPTFAPPSALSAPLPSLTGELAGATYQLVAIATATAGLPTTSTVVSGFTPGTAVTFGSWMSPPSAIAATTSGTYSFTAASGASLHMVNLIDPTGGNLLWSITLLDGSTSFTLPTLSPSPVPAGALTMYVQGLTVPGFIPTDFTVADVTLKATSLASDQASVTP
jgi:hypothetical protein